MAGTNSYGGNRRSNYGGNNTTNKTAGNTAVANGERSEPILERFVNTSKSGKALTFYVGEKGFSIPGKSRAVISALTEKQIAGLKRVREEKGYDTDVMPTHKLSVFKAE